MNNELINIYRKFPSLYKVIAILNEYNTGRINTYHNNLHMFEVFEQCVDIVDNLDTEINEEALYVAALFHDYGHYGKMGINYPDNVNIENAISDFKNLMNQYFDVSFIDTVSDIIKSTQYPDVMNNDDKTIEMLIINDADMTAQFRNNWLITICGGMKKEMGNDDNNYFLNQKKFIDSLKFNTQYCKDRWEHYKPIRLEELESLSLCYHLSI